MEMLIFFLTMANSRIYVQSSIKTAFIEQFSKLASSRSLGNPTKSEVNHGPQADQTQYETVQRYIKLGKQDANAPSQTSKSADGPLLVEPVILTDQPEDSPVVKEEIFGPVVVINTFETEDESRRRTTPNSGCTLRESTLPFEFYRATADTS